MGSFDPYQSRFFGNSGMIIEMEVVMPITNIIALFAIVVAFALFAVVLAWGQYQTAGKKN